MNYVDQRRSCATDIAIYINKIMTHKMTTKATVDNYNVYSLRAIKVYFKTDFFALYILRDYYRMSL